MARLSDEQQKRRERYQANKEEIIKKQLAYYARKRSERQEYQRTYNAARRRAVAEVRLLVDENGTVLRSYSKSIKKG